MREEKKNCPGNHSKAKLQCYGDNSATLFLKFLFYVLFLVFLKKEPKKNAQGHKRPDCHISELIFCAAAAALHMCEQRIQGCKKPGIDFLISVITLCACSAGEDKNTLARTRTLCQAALKSTPFVPSLAAATSRTPWPVEKKIIAKNRTWVCRFF